MQLIDIIRTGIVNLQGALKSKSLHRISSLELYWLLG